MAALGAGGLASGAAVAALERYRPQLILTSLVLLAASHGCALARIRAGERVHTRLLWFTTAVSLLFMGWTLWQRGLA